jgi:hypothetical protein
MLLRTLTGIAALTCQSESGQPVDWWVALKAPRGTAYLYADSTTPSLTPSPHSMNDTATGALTHTLQQLWTLPPDGSYVLWNDSPPGAAAYNYSYGHTKGITATTATGGFWLTHSIPLFPAGPGSTPVYEGLGSNAWTYGQSAACLSVDPVTLDAIAYKYLLAHPQVYDTVIDTVAAPGNLSALARGTFHDPAVCAEASLLETQSGAPFAAFAKTPAWNADLWSACVAPALSTDLRVESWLYGAQEGPEHSGDYETTDVKGVAFGPGSGSGSGSEPFKWANADDHSKWAVSTMAEDGAICFGDINRVTSQLARAGGAVCFLDVLELATMVRAATD